MGRGKASKAQPRANRGKNKNKDEEVDSETEPTSLIPGSGNAAGDVESNWGGLLGDGSNTGSGGRIKSTAGEDQEMNPWVKKQNEKEERKQALKQYEERKTRKNKIIQEILKKGGPKGIHRYFHLYNYLQFDILYIEKNVLW